MTVGALVDGDAPSTKQALGALRRVSERPRALVVVERTDSASRLSLRNVDTIHLVTVDQLNTYDVLLSDDVIFTRAAYDALVTKQVTKQAAKQQPRGTATPTDKTEPEQEESA